MSTVLVTKINFRPVNQTVCDFHCSFCLNNIYIKIQKALWIFLHRVEMSNCLDSIAVNQVFSGPLLQCDNSFILILFHLQRH